MKPFSYQSDLFIPTLFISASMQLSLLGIAHFQPTSPQLSIINAPSSVEIVLIEERVVPQKKPVETIIEDMKITEESVEPVVDEVFVQEAAILEKNNVAPLIEEKDTPDSVMETLEEEKVFQTAESTESQGVQIKAQPLKYVNPPPIYPKRALQRGWEGTVILKVFVENNGLSGRIEIAQSSGYKILDHEALNAVRLWKFIPAQIRDLKFSSWITIPIEFKLTVN